MAEKKSLLVNIAIFPKIMTITVGKPIQAEGLDENDDILKSIPDPDIVADLPRSANVLYLQRILSKHDSIECKLLEQYVYGVVFSDEDYRELIKLVFTSANQPVKQQISSSQKELLGLYGLAIDRDENGQGHLILLEDQIPQIKAETWDCITVDFLHKQAFDIIECFDFEGEWHGEKKSFDAAFKISLGAWKTNVNEQIQSLNNALRSAFMFTLVGFNWGDKKDQYTNFSEYFDAEFYKRVSLVFECWKNRDSHQKIKYIPIYDSFYNLQGNTKDELVAVLKTILDSEDVAIDDKEMLRMRLIEGANAIHQDAKTEASAVDLENNLIKPAINLVLLREKYKESLETAKILLDHKKYLDCANRCYYAMMDALKTLLEHDGTLAAWKPDELKEAESHKKLEKALSDLVTEGKIAPSYESDYEFVLTQRLKCDYSHYIFNKNDAQNCYNKAERFCQEVEHLIQ